MPRFANRRDLSHRAIADALKAVGAKVVEGFDCDLYVAFRERCWLVECKSEDAQRKRGPGLRKAASRKKQVALKEIFQGQYVIAFTPEDALRAIGAMA